MDLVVCCLGNPGDAYRDTRHNIGFNAGKQLCKDWALEKQGKKFKSHLYKGVVDGKQILVQFPQTYMNLSGEAIQPLMGFYKVPPSNLVVVYDDFDIPLGEVRLRGKGSAGTHNGMKSIVQQLGTSDFPRLRLGIGPLPQFISVTDFVLAKFKDDEQEKVASLIEKTVSAMALIRDLPIEQAMNQINTKNKPKKIDTTPED